ncbi:BPI fold-containing family B member 6-like [Discoglossus pictus]
MNFNIKFSVDEKSLHAVLSLDRTFLSILSSTVGDFEVAKLDEFITSVLKEAYTPTINDLLQTVFPLPDMISMLNINFAKANIEAVKDLLVISINVCRA